jgi:hypothetical protein
MTTTAKRAGWNVSAVLAKSSRQYTVVLEKS